jgi:hypothetical protein
MHVIWSFRSPKQRPAGWVEERHHLFAWTLSVMTAHEQYGATALLTDTRGSEVLIEGLGLPFDDVSTELDDLPAAAPERLHAYRLQTGPFIHLDPDVFLWRPLPDTVSGAPVFAQNPGPFVFGSAGGDRLGDLDRALQEQGGWRPAWWVWVLENRPESTINCALVGANRVDFMQEFAGEAVRFFEEEASAAAWQAIHLWSDEAAELEQYLLAAYLAYARQTAPPSSAPEVAYLFDSLPAAAASVAEGYTRLGPVGRQDRYLLERLEKRVACDHPLQHQRLLRLLAAWRGW